MQKNQPQERQNLNDDQKNIRWVDVPGDGSCLFWSTALAYLIPVKDNDNLFAERYERLFGDDVLQNLEDVRSLIRKNELGNDVLAGLIRHNFRDRVVSHIENNKEDFRPFFVSDEGFASHVESMRNSETWGGEHEIRAMSEMLGALITVHNDAVVRYGDGNVKINLLHTGSQYQRNHYKFGLDIGLIDHNTVQILGGSLNKYHQTSSKPQDFELIQLLIEELDFIGTSNVGKQRRDFDSFQARFQSFIDQIPSYLHSVKKDGFFTHFFLGSFSVVLDTKIAEKLDVKKIYFSFGSAKTLKVAVIKNGEISNPQDVIEKVKLLIISEKQEKNPNKKSRGDDPDRKFRGKELINLWDTPPSYIDDEAIREIENTMKVKLVEIKKSSEEISVNVEDENMGYGEDEKKVYKFKEIKRGLWNDPESYIVQISKPSTEQVRDSLGELLGKINVIHAQYKNEIQYVKSAREAADHGFIAGVFVNFRYRYNLRIYLEQFAGRGYADVVLLARGPDRSTNSIPIIIEVKAGESRVSAPDRALRQAEAYARGFQPNVMRVLTTADSILYVGVNFDHASPVSEVRSLQRNVETLPLFEDTLIFSNRWNQGRSTYDELQQRIRDNLQRIHHTFPGTAEKSDNHYFSRYLLGQLLLLDRVDALDTDFDKYIFSYIEVVPTETHLVSGRRQRPAAQVSRERMSTGLDGSHAIVTIVLIPRSAEKLVYVINIGEANRKVVGDEIVRVPLENLGGQIGKRKILTLGLNFNLKLRSKAQDFSSYLDVEVSSYSSLLEYNSIVGSALRGVFVHLPYHRELREAFDRALDYRGSSAESLELSQPSTIDRYRGLLQRVGVEMFPFRSQINSESNFQAVLHGVFSHYSDLKLNESPENRLLVLTEFQTGRGDRIDMLIQRVRFSGQNEEYTPIGLELKISRDGRNVQSALREAENDIHKYYEKGVTYKTLTDGSEVKFIAVAFNRGASNENSPLILISSGEITVPVVHSSILELDVQRSCSRGGRGKRNVAMPCVDSRSEKEIIEQKRDIQKLVDNKVIKKINLKRLEIEVSNRYEEIIDDIQSINKVEILNNAVKSVEFAKILSLDQDNKTLQKKAYYNALMDLGALLCDYTDHMYGYGDRSSALREKIKKNELFSAAHDLYRLSHNEGRSGLYSSKNLNNYNALEFDAAWLNDCFRNSNLEDFQEAYNEEVIILHKSSILYRGRNIYAKTKNIDKKLVIGNYESISNPENYLLDEETSEIKIISENEEYSLLTGIQGENTRHYFALDYGYKAKVADVIDGFDNKKAIHDKLHTLELLASKKEIEEIADSEITDSDYDNTIDVLKEEMLKKGITEEHFSKLKDNLNEEIFIKYIDTIENRLVKHNTEFNSDKFKLARANSIKGGKLLSLMAVYDLLDSVRDVSTLGRHDNSVLKRVFGVNGILDAVNDVRESISTSYVHGNRVKTKISSDSIAGRVVSKIPGSVRKNLVKIIDNPAVRSITFVTIAYQFGHSVKEIVGGNHHPLNYYWAGSSSIKLASMSIRPISIGVSAVSGRFIRVLSVAGKLLGKLSVVTGIIDIAITAAIDMYQAKEYVDEISSHIPLLFRERYNLFREKSWFADLYLSCTLIGSITTDVINSKYENILSSCFSAFKRILTGSDNLSKSYENDIKVKNYLNLIKEGQARMLFCDASLLAVVQYPSTLREIENEIIDKVVHIPSIMPTSVCKTKKEQAALLFDLYDIDSDLSSLNISSTLTLVPYTLNGSTVYVADIDKKHIPHLTQSEYNNGLRIVTATTEFKYEVREKTLNRITNGIALVCPVGRIYKEYEKVFTFLGEPLTLTNNTRKTGYIFYSSVPKKFTAAENYPAVILLPKGEVHCIGSKNHETVFLISQSSGNLEGGMGKKNTVVIDSDESIKAELDRGILEYGKNKIGLKNIYNLIVNSSGGYNITTDCNTKFISTNGTADLTVVKQGQSKCSIADYEVREVSSKSSHFRGMKQTTFIISKDSHEAMIFSPKEMHNKRNIDVISVKSNIAGSDKNKDINVTICPTVSSNKGKYNIEVAILKIRKDVLSANYVLDLLDNREKIISSIYIENVENLQVEKDGYYYKVDVDAMKLERILPAFEDVVMDYPTSLTRYQPDREYGLQIYRDRDSNIGLVDLRDKSIVDFNMEIVGDGLILLYRSNPFVKIENWNIDLSTRRMILIFSDAQIFDPNCMSSNCDPRGIVKGFNQVLEFLKNNPNTQKYIFSSEVICKIIKESIPCGWLEGPFTPKCKPTGFLSGYYHVVEREECAPEVLSKNEIYLNQTRKISKRSTRQFVTSSASRPTSFINTVANTVTNAILGFIQGVSQFISAEKHSTSQQHVQISDTNSTLLLLDVFIRKITGEKYVSLAEQSISSLEARGYALNITEGFKKVVERATLKSGVSIHRLNIDFVKIYKEITGKVISGNFDEIPGILSSCVEKVCPGRGAECTGKLSPKKFDKFVAEFNKGMINQSTEKILHNGDSRSEVDGAKQMNLEPQSYFSNASVHSHSEVSTCLSEIGITKLGGNLNR